MLIDHLEGLWFHLTRIWMQSKRAESRRLEMDVYEDPYGGEVKQPLGFGGL